MTTETLTPSKNGQHLTADGGVYNYERFRTRHLLSDVQGTMERRGIQPGEPAPDFGLAVVGGGALRLSDLVGRPVLLHFGSFT